jgi:hypothetical protein
VRDLRDPQKLGDLLTQLHDYAAVVDQPASKTYDENRLMLDCVPAIVDPDPVARYRSEPETIIETSYRRLPIEKLGDRQ